MKNLSIVLNVVLFVAVIVLYVLYFSGACIRAPALRGCSAHGAGKGASAVPPFSGTEGAGCNSFSLQAA